jgi:hypothetical protein
VKPSGTPPAVSASPTGVTKGVEAPVKPAAKPASKGLFGFLSKAPATTAPRKVVTATRKVSRLDKLKKQVGGFLFQLLTLAAFLTAFGIWGYSQVMKQVVGRFDFFDWQVAAATLYGAPNVLLIDPIRTEEFLRPDSAHHDTLNPYHPRGDDWPLLDTLWYAPGIPMHSKDGFQAWELMGNEDFKQAGMADPWKELLFRNKIAFNLVQEPALTEIPEDVNMVILPGCLLLSNEEKLGIKEFVMNGGKLLFCWSPGCRDENGNWAGYTFLEQIVGGTLAGLVEDPTGGETILLNGSGPITAMVAPGAHLEYFTWNGNIKLNVIEPRTTVDAWEFDPYWLNGGESAAGSHPALAAHGTYVAGKFVWFSFTPDAIQPHKDNHTIMAKLALNAIDWLSGKPLADISIWPPGYSAGGSIMVKGSGSNEAIAQIQASLADHREAFDLILDPDDIPEDIELFGSKWSDIVMGSSDTALFNSINPSDIFDWMEGSCVRLEHITGRRPRGLIFPYWDYGEFAAVGAATEGMRFVLGSPNPRFYGPTESLLRPHGWWMFSEKVQLATVPKCQVSAAEWVEFGMLKGSDGIFRAMSNDMKRIRRMGGMYIAILDPDPLLEQRASDLGERIAAKMDTLGFWLAPVGDVVDRFSGWRGMRVSITEVNATRMNMDISNESDVTMNGVRMELYLTPNIIQSVEISSQTMGIKPGNVDWNRQQGRCAFSVSEVSAGGNVSISIDVTTGEVKTAKK